MDNNLINNSLKFYEIALKTNYNYDHQDSSISNNQYADFLLITPLFPLHSYNQYSSGLIISKNNVLIEQ